MPGARFTLYRLNAETNADGPVMKLFHMSSRSLHCTHHLISKPQSQYCSNISSEFEGMPGNDHCTVWSRCMLVFLRLIPIYPGITAAPASTWKPHWNLMFASHTNIARSYPVSSGLFQGHYTALRQWRRCYRCKFLDTSSKIQGDRGVTVSE